MFVTKFSKNRIKTVGGLARFEIAAPYSPVLKLLADPQNICNFIFPHDYLIYHKVWLISDNQMPRGLDHVDALLGYLLVKRKPVMYK